MSQPNDPTNGAAPGAAPLSFDRLGRGVNIARWFRYPAEDSDSHFRGFITDADLDLLVAMGAATVRLAVAPPQLLSQGSDDRIDPRRLAWLDEAVGRMTARGLVAVLQYHDETRAMETSAEAVDAFERVWKVLAAHYARTPPERLLLEVLNEPVFDARPRAWFPIQRRLVAAIRAAAPLHTIVTGGPNWSSLDGLLMGRPVDDPNVLYTFHFYEPYEFTHQGAPWAPAHVRVRSGIPYPASRAAAGYVEARVALAAGWGRRYGVPVWAGEFGAYPPAAPRADRLRWLYDVRTALERHGVGWAVWSYDESLGLDRQIDADGRVTLDVESAAALGFAVPGAALTA
jgi:endoglucanase